jgi:hypothetical protein
MAAVTAAVRPLYIDNWREWLALISQQGVLIELLALAVCGLLALGMTVALRRAAASIGAERARAAGGAPPESDDRPAVLLGKRGLQGVLFPLLWLLLAYMARLLLLEWQRAPVLRVAVPALIALAAIRGGVTVLREIGRAHV